MRKQAYHIKNRVCRRCDMVIEQILNHLQISEYQYDLGQISFEPPLAEDQMKKFEEALIEVGFELHEAHKDKRVAEAKKFIVEQIDQMAKEQSTIPSSWVKWLEDRIPLEGNHLSKKFREEEGQTLEHFILSTRLDKVKELMVYENMSLKEITYRLGYSNVPHLSRQFKQYSGVSPREFLKNLQKGPSA